MSGDGRDDAWRFGHITWVGDPPPTRRFNIGFALDDDYKLNDVAHYGSQWFVVTPMLRFTPRVGERVAVLSDTWPLRALVIGEVMVWDHRRAGGAA